MKFKKFYFSALAMSRAFMTAWAPIKKPIAAAYRPEYTSSSIMFSTAGT
jgi:hypothetical protein